MKTIVIPSDDMDDLWSKRKLQEEGSGKGTIIAMRCMEHNSTRSWLIGSDWYKPKLDKDQTEDWHAAKKVALTVQDVGHSRIINTYRNGRFYVRVDAPDVDPLHGTCYCWGDDRMFKGQFPKSHDNLPRFRLRSTGEPVEDVEVEGEQDLKEDKCQEADNVDEWDDEEVNDDEENNVEEADIEEVGEENVVPLPSSRPRYRTAQAPTAADTPSPRTSVRYVEDSSQVRTGSNRSEFESVKKLPQHLPDVAKIQEEDKPRVKD
jgi:hypothetical protein